MEKNIIHRRTRGHKRELRGLAYREFHKAKDEDGPEAPKIRV